MQRHDLFTPVHKGLRALMFDTARGVARADFGSPPEAAAAADAVRSMLGFLREHEEHVRREILPLLSRLAPDLATDLQSELARVGGLAQGLGDLAARLGAADAAHREALGRRLHQQLALLIAEQLRHMARQETEGNRMLWAHLGDAELSEVQHRVTSAIAAPRLAAWLALLLPAVSPGERAGVAAALCTGLSVARLEEATAGSEGGRR